MANLQVDVRMYAVGELGDCFFLQFAEGESQSSVLIDCGSFRNNGKSIPHMQNIVSHIKEAQTSPDEKTVRPLDLVIGTHQHNDHLSGFVHGHDIFKEMGMKNVWLSWLDDPTDGKAQLIADGQRKVTDKLKEVSARLKGFTNADGSEKAERINDILGFYAMDSAQALAPPLKPGEKQLNAPAVPQQGVSNLKAIGGSNVSYLNPGQVLDLPGLSQGAVKVYVLGPPRDNNLLFDINPGKDESYDAKLTSTLHMADGLLSALTNFKDGESIAENETGSVAPDEPFFPFDKKYERKDKSKSDYISKLYLDPDLAWRNIDTDWLDQGERLALYLDSYTNNSSLVLAFELVEAKKVLLFVGDAQTGNWLSWKTIDWGKSAVSLDYLLSHTVLYKVGHHCSHNATLPENLEKMKHPELVAMIPVDISDPNITKNNGWKMPAANLYNRIKEVTSGRVLRMDRRYEADCGPDALKVDEQWGPLLQNIEHFKTPPTAGVDFVSYTIKGN